MPLASDRRTFLVAAGQFALGGLAFGTSAPPRSPGSNDLKALPGDATLPLPSGASARLGDPGMRIHGDLKAVQFTPTGTTLVGAGQNELRGWDPRTGQVRFRLAYPDGANVNSGRLTSRDEFALLVNRHSGNKAEFRYYSFTGKHVRSSPPLALDDSQHTAFSADGSLAAVVLQGALVVYEGATGKEKWRVTLPAEAIGGCWFFPDGSAVALATKGAIRVFGSAAGKVTTELKVGAVGEEKEATRGGRGRDWTQDVQVSADGRWLAAGVGEDGDEVIVWDVKPAAVRHRLKPAAKPLGFTAGGVELITYSTGAVSVWSMTAGKRFRTFDVPLDYDPVLSPDGRIVASVAGDSAVLMDTATGKAVPHSPDPPGTPADMWIAPDGRLVGRLAGWGGWVEWDLGTRTSRLIRPPGVSGRTALSLSVDRRATLFRHKEDYEIRDVATGNILVAAKGPGDLPDEMPVAAITPDGKSIVFVDELGLAVVHGKDRQTLNRAGEPGGSVRGVDVSPDGAFVAACYEGGNNRHLVDVFDLAKGRFLRRLAIDGEVHQMTSAPDGPWLVAAHEMPHPDGHFNSRFAATVFDVTTGRAVLQVAAEGRRDQAIALSPDGRLLARCETVTKEGQQAVYRIAVWEILAGKVRAHLEAGGSVVSVAFAPDGRTLAASVEGAPVFVWDLFAEAKDSPPWPADSDQAWTDLRADNAAAAFAAVRWLARNVGTAVGFLRARVPPVPPPDPADVSRRIADLDHKDFRRREVATKALADLGERVREPLQKALAAGGSPEARTRIERLLAGDARVTSEQLQVLRAVEAMEVTGTPEARKLLAHWAGGAPGAGLTRAAAGALNRLAARGIR